MVTPTKSKPCVEVNGLIAFNTPDSTQISQASANSSNPTTKDDSDFEKLKDSRGGHGNVDDDDDDDDMLLEDLNKLLDRELMRKQAATSNMLGVTNGSVVFRTPEQVTTNKIN